MEIIRPRKTSGVDKNRAHSVIVSTTLSLKMKWKLYWWFAA